MRFDALHRRRAPAHGWRMAAAAKRLGFNVQSIQKARQIGTARRCRSKVG